MRIVSYPFKIAENRGDGGSNGCQLSKLVCDVRLQYNLIFTWVHNRVKKRAECQLRGTANMGAHKVRTLTQFQYKSILFSFQRPSLLSC